MWNGRMDDFCVLVTLLEQVGEMNSMLVEFDQVAEVKRGSSRRSVAKQSDRSTGLRRGPWRIGYVFVDSLQLSMWSSDIGWAQDDRMRNLRRFQRDTNGLQASGDNGMEGKCRRSRYGLNEKKVDKVWYLWLSNVGIGSDLTGFAMALFDPCFPAMSRAEHGRSHSPFVLDRAKDFDVDGVRR